MAWLDQHIPFDATADLTALLETAPAKWAVYLLSDREQRPVQLLCVKNLRASLATRLGERPPEGKTKAVAYRQLVRHVHYRRVDSELEADWHYQGALKELFPEAHQKLLANRQYWFVSVDEGARFPRFAITNNPLDEPPGSTFGPIAGKNAAGKFVETLEDAFDLCRYHHILTQAPHGQACAYKQMHKCPAPCDGSISMGMYRMMIASAVGFLHDPAGGIAPLQQRMQQAAEGRLFELAGKIKNALQQLQTLAGGAYQKMVPLPRLEFVAVMRSGTAKQFKLMLLTPWEIRMLADENEALAPLPRSKGEMELLGLVCQHYLVDSRNTMLLPRETLTPEALAKAKQALGRRKEERPDDGEGLLRETAP